MKTFRLVLVPLAAGVVAVTGVGLASATTKTATRPLLYALGHSKKCETGYIKQTERHKVASKSVRYVGCVEVFPSGTKSTAVTTTATLSTSSPATTVVHAAGNTGVAPTSTTIATGNSGGALRTTTTEAITRNCSVSNPGPVFGNYPTFQQGLGTVYIAGYMDTVTYQCSFTVNVSATDGVSSMNSAVSTNVCTPNQGSCGFSLSQSFSGPLSPIAGYAVAPTLPACSTLTEGVTASFAGTASDLASSSSTQQVSAVASCN